MLYAWGYKRIIVYLYIDLSDFHSKIVRSNQYQQQSITIWVIGQKGNIIIAFFAIDEFWIAFLDTSQLFLAFPVLENQPPVQRIKGNLWFIFKHHISWHTFVHLMWFSFQTFCPVNLFTFFSLPQRQAGRPTNGTTRQHCTYYIIFCIQISHINSHYHVHLTSLYINSRIQKWPVLF